MTERVRAACVGTHSTHKRYLLAIWLAEVTLNKPCGTCATPLAPSASKRVLASSDWRPCPFLAHEFCCRVWPTSVLDHDIRDLTKHPLIELLADSFDTRHRGRTLFNGW